MRVLIFMLSFDCTIRMDLYHSHDPPGFVEVSM